MKKNVEKWRSPSLGTDMEIAVYGNSGTPIIGLPSRESGISQWEDKGMTKALSKQITNEYNQLFCVSTIDGRSFFNKNIKPEQRLVCHNQYEAYLTDEVVPYISEANSNPFIIIAGVDIGGYQAINTALKHPGLFGKAIGISGTYDISNFLGEYYDEDVYYNNPVDYLPNLDRQNMLDKVREVDFRLISYDGDPHRSDAMQMSNIFHAKFIEHHLDVWEGGPKDNWNVWPKMLRKHII